ncbi:hypothetical protein BHE74_00004788 [Ensete ventricosum]|nr:hypothetical protein BHE74_00004788 [Ensete ventricosum]RZR83233.1 hypothetical protein BHM03_00009802 [Ensete ventricosum]
MLWGHALTVQALLCFACVVSQAAGGPAASMKPASAVAPGLKSVLIDEAKRRRLSSFQICALCTCCGGPRGICLPSPCCYAINCNIPNRPFGFCSFTPKTCNCFGCHL